MRRFVNIIILTLVFSCAFEMGCHAQKIAVKTNLLNWAVCTPDIGVEVITGERTSVALSAFGHYKPYGVWDSKVIAIQPEFRYWFGGRPLVREYIGATLGLTAYDTKLFGQRYRDGLALLAGITGGYVFPLGKRWAFDLSAGAGIAVYRHVQHGADDNFDDYNPDYNAHRNVGYSFFPVKLNAGIIYIIK